MFDMYIIPEDAHSFPYPIYRFSRRTAGECSSFFSHLRRCAMIVTFAGVVPDFTPFTPEGVYTIIPLEGNHAAR